MGNSLNGSKQLIRCNRTLQKPTEIELKGFIYICDAQMSSWVSRDLDYAGWVVRNVSVVIMSLSLHLPQLFSQLIQFLFAVMLQKCFVGYETSPTFRLLQVESDNDFVVFVFVFK